MKSTIGGAPAGPKVLAIGKRGVISSRMSGPLGAVLIPFSGGGPAVAR